MRPRTNNTPLPSYEPCSKYSPARIRSITVDGRLKDALASRDRSSAQRRLEPISGLRHIRSRFLLVHATGEGWHPPNGFARRATVVRRRTERASHCGCLTRTTVRTHPSATHPQVMECAVTVRGRTSLLPGVERLRPALTGRGRPVRLLSSPASVWGSLI